MNRYKSDEAHTERDILPAIRDEETDELVCMCFDERTRDLILKLLNEQEHN